MTKWNPLMMNHTLNVCNTLLKKGSPYLMYSIPSLLGMYPSLGHLDLRILIPF